MKDKILATYIGVDLAFLGTGALLIGFAFVTKNEINSTQTIKNVATDLLFKMCPLDAAIGNAIFVFVTFLMTLPAIVMPMTRGWLKFSGYLVVISGLFTMINGLSIWFETLKTRGNLGVLWGQQSAATQSLLQTKFDCCGYQNSTDPPFVPDATCPNALAAAAKEGCVAKFSSDANDLLAVIFTLFFGIVGIDVLLIMATAVLLKDRREKERYRHIDEKTGTGAF